mmetsp:Transcript_20611/g.28799  ORF Transcript_20611/g.28799 Transcript_20611/m.28799 type:complete len:398 (-) Transcript_20611:299-1492(-)|eukprot:CAMPEP_0184480456 /NCGR_PEP_ID=MMETSP0113_2-20130426/1963_1 /TAXON_ID=91329 /ORGANISM="Norrisiella sphaerica, Strain BC52" /LENGTH=397 /DNA_ID=CAMNT_0026858957 /DNA_START=187 /DNA_END=1380 /DNA_ORIENTATION=-
MKLSPCTTLFLAASAAIFEPAQCSVSRTGMRTNMQHRISDLGKPNQPSLTSSSLGLQKRNTLLRKTNLVTRAHPASSDKVNKNFLRRERRASPVSTRLSSPSVASTKSVAPITAVNNAAVVVESQEITKAFNTPKQIFTALVDTATVKVKTATPELLLAGFLAGAYISMGGALQFMVGANLGGLRAAEMGGLVTLAMASVFPVCFIIHVLAGSELWTGNCAVLGAGALQKKCSWLQVLRHWTISYIGNFAGALAFGYFLIFKAGLANAAFSNLIGNLAIAKTSLTFSEAFLRGIGANWLVCLAVLLVQSSTSVPGKIMGAWFPIMTFVAIGFEHSVANMFAIPLAYMTQAESLMQFKDMLLAFLGKNLLPVTLGNVVGGLVFVGMFYDRILMKASKS